MSETESLGCVRSLIDLKRLAAHSRCRVKELRLTQEEARRLAAEMAWECSPSLLYESMCEGKVRVLGMSVRVAE